MRRQFDDHRREEQVGQGSEHKSGGSGTVAWLLSSNGGRATSKTGRRTPGQSAPNRLLGSAIYHQEEAARIR